MPTLDVANGIVQEARRLGLLDARKLGRLERAEVSIRTAWRDASYGLENLGTIGRWIPALMEGGPPQAFEVITRLNAERRLKGLLEMKEGLAFYYRDTHLTFHRGHLPIQELYNGIYACFVKREYGGVDYAGRTVLDVGLTFGDSVMFEVASGAKRVVGFEPDPAFAELCRHNIALNGFQGRATVNPHMIVDGLTAQRGDAWVDFASNKGVDELMAGKEGRGTRVPTMTPPQAIELAHLEGEDNILKMDCEGCEYNLLSALPPDPKLFNLFSDLLIEYHDGSGPLEFLFGHLGFKTAQRTGPYGDCRHSRFGILHMTRRRA